MTGIIISVILFVPALLGIGLAIVGTDPVAA